MSGATRMGTFRPDMRTWNDLYSDDGTPTFPDQKILAEGDSWFTISGLPAYNLLFELRFSCHTMIVNCALPGDTIKHMSVITRNRNLREALTNGDFSWDLILLSGGGNDFIDEAEDIILPREKRTVATGGNPADYCDQEILRTLIREVQDGYRRIAGLRDVGGRSRNTPILVHTYDYATPRNAPARFLFASLGPWLYRAVTKREVPETDWIPLGDYIIDQLAETLLALQHGPDPIANFHVVDTRNTLTRAQPGSRGNNHDWQNEIHPNSDGYEKLARAMDPKLQALLKQSS